jgi:hypothetical protein
MCLENLDHFQMSLSGPQIQYRNSSELDICTVSGAR